MMRPVVHSPCTVEVPRARWALLLLSLPAVLPSVAAAPLREQPALAPEQPLVRRQRPRQPSPEGPDIAASWLETGQAWWPFAYMEHSLETVWPFSRLQEVNATFDCSSNQAHPNLTIVTVSVGLPDDLVQLLRKNRLMEANEYGYEYCQFSHPLDTSRDLAWSKVKAIQELLSHGRKRIVWMDADAFFTNRKSFDDITGSYLHKKDIVFTDDKIDSSPVNTGVMDMRNTPWTVAFWQSVYEKFPEAIDHPFWDQQGVILYRERFRSDFDEHCEIIDHALMNSVGEKEAPFIAHRAGGHVWFKYHELIPWVESTNEQLSVGSSSFLDEGELFTSRWSVALERAVYQRAS